MPDTPLTRDEARERARLLSDVRYQVDLDLTVGDHQFRSATRVHFACREPGAATFVDLEADTIERVELNGRLLADKTQRAGRIALDDLAAHNELLVVAHCRYQRTGVGLHRFADPVDGGVYLHTQFEPFDAHRVFACFDQPDLKATFTLHVRAPGAWTVVTNSNPTAGAPSPDAETVDWRFAPTPPLSTYLTALVAGPLVAVHDRHGDIELGLYCRASLAEHLDADEMFAVTRQGFDFFTEKFGYPYPFGKYDQVFVPEFNFGAMENPGCVTFSETYVFRSRVTEAARRSRANTILHEMAHMWFGDLVTMRWWDDLWLNESFATYTATLAAAEATRFTDSWAAFASGTKAWAIAQDQLPSTHPIAADMTDTDVVRVLFDGITYAKGAAVLKQLVHWVGDDAFTSGLRGYFQSHQWGNATLADFLAALEKGSGRDLADWSRQWLQTSGVTTLRPATVEDPGQDGRYDRVEIVQEAPPGHPQLRSHRVAIGLYDVTPAGVRRRRRVELDVVGARTVVDDLRGEPVPALLLVNDDDLAYAKVRLDQRSLRTLQQHLGRIDEPLARAICWGATWDMTRDAELPASRFVALVAEHGTAEGDVGLLQTLQRQAESAVDRYADPRNRPRLRALLAGQARAALAAADPGGDTQLLWARALASTGDAPEDVRLVRGLLDGSDRIEGLAVDTDLRWHLLTALAAGGHTDEDEIAAEERRDPTDFGRRRAATARAARPLAEAKEAAFVALLEDHDLPLAMMRALVAGLHQPGQDELLRGYVGRYPDAVQRVWSDRGADEALLLTSGLYPSALVDLEVVTAADRALAAGLPPPGTRLVAEARDSTLRALRARAADAAD